MFLLKIFRPKNLLKLAWFAFGAFGLYIVIKQYYPDFPKNLATSSLIKGVQGSLVSSGESPQPLNLNNLKDLTPQEVSQAISQAVKQEITQILETTTTQIRQFPAQQVRKIKIGACENLLEEDICNVAKEIKCQ
ncbi:MAG: hypothetical protein NTZ93_03110 [Candidatus Beckwithbacteria bacterium]|nr:hypothetical protein [Candidatus Beckwithbacteria bacterium]